MGIHGLIGVDEVGRGCWAGPLLVVAARANAKLPAGLKDSKLLSKRKRQQFYDELIGVCEFGEGWVSPKEIDEIGLGKALYLAGSRALADINAMDSEPIILDGAYNYLPAKFTSVKYFPKADNLQPVVSAASIYAKVLRDKHMADLAIQYPGYNFDAHVGYGTKSHIEAIKLMGAIKTVHRFSFAPLAELV